MTRHESRSEAFCLMFEYSFGGNPDEIMSNAIEYREETISEFAKKLFIGTVNNLSDIDNMIASYSEKRSFTRIGKVPLACMRIAAYEIFYTETPHEIVINEALELCREYNCDDSVGFVNGLLGKISLQKKNNNG